MPRVPVEVYFDIEYDPLRDLVYLHGFVVRKGGENATERHTAIWAEGLTPLAEGDAFAAAWTFLQQHLESLVVYYSKHERIQYRMLAAKYPQVCDVSEVDALFTLPRSLDLYFDVVKSGSEWPTLDFSVKTLAKYLGFSWRDSDPSGAASIEWFDRWARTGDAAVRRRLLDYNEDDCVATRVVLDAVRGMEVRESR
ncbi:MAG: TM0106 family RecB-like putative nuclease [Phycisphaerae bacterium]|nr:TM0106 family RecB-like putative nuclease [Phycisphaerae bacterium]